MSMGRYLSLCASVSGCCGEGLKLCLDSEQSSLQDATTRSLKYELLLPIGTFMKEGRRLRGD